MDYINRVTSDALQKHTLVLTDGTPIELTIEFKPLQLGWFIREMVYGDFTLNGFRIFISPNMLYQFRNQIPFGICVTSNGNREPMLIDDFSSGAVKMYILSAAEMLAYTEFLSGG